MIEIIAPEQFKTIPWKNGKGQTTELAISDGGTLANFDWRISIASVVENGLFSDFSGYWRNLVLIEGGGITLEHDNDQIDNLNDMLNVATFDGGCKTQGTLTQGAIKDLNVITDSKTYLTKVQTYVKRQTVELLPCQHCFIFSLGSDAVLLSGQVLPQGHLLHITEFDDNEISITGQSMIVARLERC